jgi:hypothetical protein
MRTALLRISFWAPILVGVAVLFHLWRLNFSGVIVYAGPVNFFFSCYNALFLRNRAMGREAKFFYVRVAADEEVSLDNPIDWPFIILAIVLVLAAVFRPFF